MIDRIEFYSIQNYDLKFVHPSGTVYPDYKITKSDILSCPNPVIDINPDADFWVNESQMLTIEAHYNFITDITANPNNTDQSQGYFFKKLFKGGYPINPSNKDLHSIIVCFFDENNNRVFDGILSSGSKKFDSENNTISFNVYDFMVVLGPYLDEAIIADNHCPFSMFNHSVWSAFRFYFTQEYEPSIFDCGAPSRGIYYYNTNFLLGGLSYPSDWVDVSGFAYLNRYDTAFDGAMCHAYIAVTGRVGATYYCRLQTKTLTNIETVLHGAIQTVSRTDRAYTEADVITLIAQYLYNPFEAINPRTGLLGLTITKSGTLNTSTRNMECSLGVSGNYKPAYIRVKADTKMADALKLILYITRSKMFVKNNNFLFADFGNQTVVAVMPWEISNQNIETVELSPIDDSMFDILQGFADPQTDEDDLIAVNYYKDKTTGFPSYNQTICYQFNVSKAHLDNPFNAGKTIGINTLIRVPAIGSVDIQNDGTGTVPAGVNPDTNIFCYVTAVQDDEEDENLIIVKGYAT